MQEPTDVPPETLPEELGGASMTSSALAVEMDIAEQAQATAMEASQTAIVRIQSMRRAQVVRRDLRRQRDAVLGELTD